MCFISLSLIVYSQEFDCEQYYLECIEAMNNAVDWADEKAISLKYVKENEYTIHLVGMKNEKPVYIGTDNLIASQTISTDEVQPGSDSGFNLTGNGITIGLWDAGQVRVAHNEFVNESGETRVIRGEDYEWEEYAHYHSTHVTGTLIAEGEILDAKGMAVGAQIKNWEWLCDTYEMCVEAQEENLLLSNHSYGERTGWNMKNDNVYWFGDVDIDQQEDYKFGYYNWKAQEYDEIAYQFSYYTIVKSAGNDRYDVNWNDDEPHFHYDELEYNDSHEVDGGDDGFDCIASDKTAKNIITVGAIYPIQGGYIITDDLEITGFSSFGPTDDGRIKPDIVASGYEQYSCFPNTLSSYYHLSGTSMAAPNVTGSLALLQEYYAQENEGEYLTSAALKAIMIHSADPSAESYGPNYKVGWGLLNTEKAVNLIAIPENNIIMGTLNTGDLLEWSIDLSFSESVKITLVWTDPSGTPVYPPVLDPSNPMLVNDLDIRLVNGDITYFPFVLDPDQPNNTPTTGDNSIDNVEQIFTILPEPGNYSLYLSHKDELINESQDFALIIAKGGPAVDIQFRNIYNGVDILNSTLSVLELNGEIIYEGLSSGETRLFAEGLSYIAKTDTQSLIYDESRIMHHDWDGDFNNYKLKSVFSAILDEPTHNAIFTNVELISIKTNSNDYFYNFNIDIRDPWYVEPEEGIDEGCIECNQLNHFHTLNEIENPNGEYWVFLNQDPPNQYYSIHSPTFIEFNDIPGSPSQAYKFDSWDFTAVTAFDDPSYPDQENYKVVIFNNAGDEILANYLCLGDINQDGQLSVLDITQIIYRVLEEIPFNDEELLICDLRGEDGLVNILDVIILIQVLLGLGLPEDLLEPDPSSGNNFNLLSKLIKNEYGSYSMVINMKNDIPVKGVQMKVKPPEGYVADSVVVGTHADNMTLSYSATDELASFLIYHVGGNSIQPGIGQIAEIFLTQNSLGKVEGDPDGGIFIEVILAGTNGDSLSHIIIPEDEFSRLNESNNDQITIPDKYSLGTPYPNPFNPIVSFNYSISEESEIKITIYNMMGQLVETIQSANHNPGYYFANWDGSQYPSGIYLINLEIRQINSNSKSEIFSKTQKVMLLK